MGKKKWRAGTVQSILENEKMMGDALLQKKFTVDFLTKKQKVNEGEVPQYYVEGSHEGIVSKEVFETVQREIKKRKSYDSRYSGMGIFSSKIICGTCGSFYGSKVWHSNDKYRKVIYRCNGKYKNEEKCTTPALREDEIQQAFIQAANLLFADKKDLIADLEELRDSLCDISPMAEEQDRLHGEIVTLVEEIQNAVSQNARVAQNQDAYRKRYDTLVSRYDTAKERYAELEERISERQARQKTLNAFIKTLKKRDGILSEFDETLWSSLVESVTVYAKDNILFTFRDGTEIRTGIE